jgi:hypothetical protein
MLFGMDISKMKISPLITMGKPVTKGNPDPGDGLLERNHALKILLYRADSGSLMEDPS